MVFSNLVFLFLFLPFVIVIYYLVPQKVKNLVLLTASLGFYAWGEPQYVLLMLVSIILNYIFGFLIHRCYDSHQIKNRILILAVSSNIAILGYYKYAGFFIENINILLRTSIPVKELPLPIGISFFTFQAMSYVIDVYRNDAKLQKSFFNLALYISLFPQLIAGPIVRYNTISDQLKERVHSIPLFSAGVKLFIFGLSKKVIIANPMGELADTIFTMNPGSMATLTAWLGVIAYTLQIYFDFSGYSDMAIGLGRLFGFEFPVNFNYPYIARSIKEFWSRWHISLSQWFRDYVYIPLGGNRVSSIRLYLNLLIVWSITGLWHGASWTFMAWGFYYGVLLIFERAGLGRILERLPRVLQHVYVLLIVMVGWVFFRADNFAYSFEYLQTLFYAHGTGIADSYTLVSLWDCRYYLLAGIIFCAPVLPHLRKKLDGIKVGLLQWSRQLAAPLFYLLLLIVNTIFLVNSTYNPFIYFRF